VFLLEIGFPLHIKFLQEAQNSFFPSWQNGLHCTVQEAQDKSQDACIEAIASPHFAGTEETTHSNNINGFQPSRLSSRPAHT